MAMNTFFSPLGLHHGTGQTVSPSRRQPTEEDDKDENGREDDPLDPSESLGRDQLAAIGDRVRVTALATAKCRGV